MSRADDLRQGLRLLFFRRQTAIAYEIDDTHAQVRVLRAIYGGQDYQALLSER